MLRHIINVMPPATIIRLSEAICQMLRDAHCTETDFVIVCVIVVVSVTSTIATALALAPALATANTHVGHISSSCKRTIDAISRCERHVSLTMNLSQRCLADYISSTGGFDNELNREETHRRQQ